MEQLLEKVKKELEQIAQQGLTGNNLDITFKLVDIAKDLGEIQKTEKGGRQMGQYDAYGRTYRDSYTDDYRNSSYDRMYRDGEYGRRGVPGSGRGGYRGDDRFTRSLDRLYEGVEDYQYGRDRYMHGGSEQQMIDGLENMMYAVCILIETAMDAADTPEAKEAIHKHLKKIKSM